MESFKTFFIKIRKEIHRVPRNVLKNLKKLTKALHPLLPKFLKRKYLNFIERIVVISGQNCSLKCKHCANFSPYLAKIIPFYPYEEICQDIAELTKHTQIKTLQFQGGEFFLHPNATQILQYTAQNPRIHRIIIATNATIVPKDSLLRIIKESGKITLRLSNYGIVNMKGIQRLESALKEWEIPYYSHHFVHQQDTWVDCGNVKMARLKDKIVQKIFKECIFGKECLTMENGFISKCSRATIAHLVQNFALSKDCGLLINPKTQRAFSAFTPLEIGGGGGVKLPELPEFNFENLQNFLSAQTPLQACYYCYGTSGQEIPAGVQLSKEELSNLTQAKFYTLNFSLP
ncbi:radical SAM protein [Helicobacter sp. MIT 21-1697]|uniref:radical SAM protein n=1 Tax=Helicobacter sp. MIT 21-1697 TaxID=2993733 RepID=UPI00224AEA71|nr:radical SAM protein [Helicobacter sp. MIT 21-1697]MCX2717606.1 radical SAM protein [Helicobacter sp. MIT 21-1697]